MDSSADFQTTKENVNHHDRANETISDFHNGVFSSTMKNGNDESRGKDLEVQIVQQNSSTPKPEKIEDKNSDCIEQNSDLKTFGDPFLNLEKFEAISKHKMKFMEVMDELEKSIKATISNDFDSRFKARESILHVVPLHFSV